MQRCHGEEVALELERREKNVLGGEAEESHRSGGYIEFGVISDQGRETGKAVCQEGEGRREWQSLQEDLTKPYLQVAKAQDCRYLWTVWWFLLSHSA